jgi:hypothetical protein
MEEVSNMSSSFDLHVSQVEITSIGSSTVSQNKQRGVVRGAWSWVINNKWAERENTPKGTVTRCLYPGCKKTYITNGMTTTGIINHLSKNHHITQDSGMNDGSLSKQGPIDVLLHSNKQPRIFDPTQFDELLVRFMVTSKQPFTIVQSEAFQDLLNHATMATLHQVKLPSNDTMAGKVNVHLFPH